MVSEGVIGTGLVTLGTLIGAIFTRRSAKDETAVGGFTALTAAMRAELDRYAVRIQKLEDNEVSRQKLARRHQAWDRMVRLELQQRGMDVPEPPPLELDHSE